MTKSTQVAIVGAGPYGLSIAAHLRARGIAFRIFGSPMQSWRERMPAGMLLKSEGFASNLYEPEGRWTLSRFCAQNGVVYGDTAVPVSLETMTSYGLSFQERLVPDLEDRAVVRLDRSPDGFLLRLNDGETLVVRRVVVAVGSSYFWYVPPGLADLPREFLSHSSEHHDLHRFKGQDVTVIGGGASALDLAALLHEIGVEVRLLIRRESVLFHSKPGPRSLWQRIRYPMSGIGPGWKSRFFTDAPMLFRYLPPTIRLRIIRTYLGPAGAGLMKDRIVGRVPLLLGRALEAATLSRGRVYLQFLGQDGARDALSTDHVIAATGYKIDLRRLPFLACEIKSSVRSFEQAPVLSRDFQSSVPGLYFVGLASAYDFGPVMRFMVGAAYTARRLSAHLAGAATSTGCRYT